MKRTIILILAFLMCCLSTIAETGHVSREINADGNMIYIDADIVSPNDMNAPKLHVKAIQWTDAELADAFLGGAQVTIEHDVFGDGSLFDGEYQNRTSRYQGPSNLSIYTYVSGILAFTAESFSDSNIPILEALPIKTGDLVEFPDFSLEEAAQYISAMTKALRLSMGEILSVHQIDAGEKSKRGLSVDEGYWLWVGLTINGFPCLPEPYFSCLRDEPLPGSSLYAYVTRDGVQYFAMLDASGYEVVDVLPGEAQSIPLDQAIDRLTKKYAEMIVEEALTIDRIVFSYVPVLQPGMMYHYTMEPAWCFFADSGEVIIFDAHSGGEII